LTPLEQALDSFLTAYDEQQCDTENNDPPSKKDVIVEYWCRQEHLNLEAHADIDEVFFERHCNGKLGDNDDSSFISSSSGFRYPTVGHVLYLTEPTLGRGPTCVFPPTTNNNNTKTTTTNYDDAVVVRTEEDDDASTDTTTSPIAEEISHVITVPAVVGRVLRFPGNALHAVPKPAHVWFSEDGAATIIMDDKDEDEGDEGDWDYDDDDDDDDAERSVILFNTWEAPEADEDDTQQDATTSIGVGPIGVRPDPMFHVTSDLELVDMMMSSVDVDDSGMEVDDDEIFVRGMVEYARRKRDALLDDWREKYCDYDGSVVDDDDDDDGKDDNAVVVYSKVHCRPQKYWKSTPVHTATVGINPEDDDGNANHDNAVVATTIRVPLMGDKLRRRHPKKTIRWRVPFSFREKSNDPERPFEFPISLYNPHSD